MLFFSRSVTFDSVTPWTAARQAFLFFTISWSLLKLMSIKSVMPSNHLVLCHPLLLQSSIFPSWCTGSFPMSQLFTSGDQSTGASALVLLMNIQDWFLLGLTGLIFLLSKGLSRIFFNTTVQKHGSDGKESTCNAGDQGSIPELGRCSGEGNGYPFQYSCLENSMERGAWWATVHKVLKSWTWVNDSHPHTPPHTFILLPWLPVAQMVKESACNAGDLGLIPESGRSSGEGNGNPLQYSCLENPMDRGAW